MKFALFYHSLLSDWNHGNAHFLRGIVSELLARGHEVAVYEPRDSWSLSNLLREHGEEPIRQFQAAYPGLESIQYDLASLDLETALRAVDIVIVHEWNDPSLVSRIGAIRARRDDFRLFFHDTHHRLISDRARLEACDLKHYDGVLAYGKVLTDLYVESGRVKNAWTWHEAADIRRFSPIPGQKREGDLVWIGNWGDGERSDELREFLIEPVRVLGLKARVYGVRYPENARRALDDAGIEYAGWLPNFAAREVFARFSLTVHVPRRPYVTALPGIPTIRVFEALACGIPLVCAPWHDAEHLFTPGADYLVVRNGKEMLHSLKHLLDHPEEGRSLAEHGRKTIERRHTCAHRVGELLTLARGWVGTPPVPPNTETSSKKAGSINHEYTTSLPRV